MSDANIDTGQGTVFLVVICTLILAASLMADAIMCMHRAKHFCWL